MIEVKRHIPEEELVGKVKETTMLRDKTIRPYEYADVTLERMNLDDFQPTQLYVLREALAIQQEVRNELLEQGHDSLELTGALHLDNDGHEVGMIPPVVEEDPEYGPCLLDGTHRVYLARKLGLVAVNVLRISNLSLDYPLSAYPNEWDEMVEYDQMPADKSLKKRYRPSYDPGSLYRDLSPLTGGERRLAASEIQNDSI